MPYLVAKKRNEHGSVAIDFVHVKNVKKLFNDLTLDTLDDQIQIFVVSDFNNYKEYAPYQSVDKEQTFVDSVLAMKQEKMSTHHVQDSEMFVSTMDFLYSLLSHPGFSNKNNKHTRFSKKQKKEIQNNNNNNVDYQYQTIGA